MEINRFPLQSIQHCFFFNGRKFQLIEKRSQEVKGKRGGEEGEAFVEREREGNKRQNDFYRNSHFSHPLISLPRKLNKMKK